MEIERVALKTDESLKYEQLERMLFQATVTIRDANEKLLVVGPLFMFPVWNDALEHAGLIQRPEKVEMPIGFEPRSLAESWAMANTMPTPRLEWVNPIIKPFTPKIWELPQGVVGLKAWTTLGQEIVWWFKGTVAPLGWVLERNDSVQLSGWRG